MDGAVPFAWGYKPSFLVDANKDLFYCYGCGRGGDVIRFAELYHQVKFPQAVAFAAPMARHGARVAGSRTFLSHSVAPAQ
jgi:DNA primase